MAGFFESRGTAVYEGLKQSVEGVRDYFHQMLGWKTKQVESVGVIGGVRDSFKALFGGAFGKNKGVFRPDNFDSYLLKKEGLFNPLRYTRRLVAGILETASTVGQRTLGLIGAQHGKLLYDLNMGLSKAAFGLFIGDMSPYTRSGAGNPAPTPS